MLKKYYSGYIDLDCKSDYGEQPYKGRYFSIYFDTPREGKSDVTCRIKDSEGNDVEVECKEAIIQTSSIENAIKVLELISAALTLLNAELYEADRTSILPFSSEERKLMAQEFMLEEKMVGNQIHAIPQVLLACKIACKVSFRRVYYNALLKYQLGNYLYSITPIELDPSHSLYYKLSPFPSDYVKFAYAIIAFYSVIEELGLEIRASEKKPSFINGKWNPVIKKDLEARLKKDGINTQELFSWILRSTPTNIERHLLKSGKLKPVKKSSWARSSVRDSKIKLVDAILLVSNLRSSISSHKFSKLVESLSIYDVSNANYLVRRLLIEKLGFWR
ncbi:MAG: hypothetical protein ACP5SP_06955 [Caldisericum sp.]|uniref:hypothetical protein n=1 Tax=Caldisericum sp. TaxID=2499687 RepID=UPI003D12987C